MKIALLVLVMSIPAWALEIQGRPEHPAIYLSQGDIARAKANREKYPWAKAAAEKLLRDADVWATKNDNEIVKLIPPEKSCFAYGFSGCPICGGTLKAWWGQDGVASLDDPGHIRCVNGHRLPDDAHPDPGDGWKANDGKKFYFVGTYNSFVIDTLTTAMDKLVLAYALTGEDKYAHKAALILDHLAAIYPGCDKGSWDYPSDPPSGRFNRPWYQVARMLIHYANHYDILLMGEELSHESSVAGMTRRQNIEQNLLLNGAKYCFDRSKEHPSLNNGECDYVRGAMVAGVAMGIPEYVAWGVDGPYGIRNMIANNIDRDGQYYETSSLYAHHSRYLYMDVAEILQRYRDEAHPNGIKLIEDPAFRSFHLLPNTRIKCTTMAPSLGDDAPHDKRIAATTQPEKSDFVSLEHLRALNDDPEIARELDAKLIELCQGNLQGARRNADPASAEWLLFHAKEPSGSPPTPSLRPATSNFLTQKGLAILRSGQEANARAATLRFGPTLNHGHLDEMNLNLYAFGYELSYDLGYALGSTHTQVGWAHQTASHNTVVVDETSQIQANGAGGSVKEFVTLPGLTFVRADDPACYTSQKVKRYERSVAMIDVSPTQSYLLDIFRVEGGSRHDHMFHALGTDLAIDGAQLGEAKPGSLAGEPIDTGAKIGSDGDVTGVTNKPYWNPPPGNGYGFLMSPRAVKSDGAWSATWTCDREAPARLRMTVLPQPGDEPVICEALGIYPKMPRSKYVVVRRHGDSNLASTFVSILEPFGDSPAVKKVERLECSGDGVAVKVALADGRGDVLIWSGSGEEIEVPGEKLRSDARFARVRFYDGKAADVVMIRGTKLVLGDESFTLPHAQFKEEIDRVDYDRQILNLKKPIALDAKDQFLYVSNPAYAQDSAYRVAAVEGTQIQLAPTRLTLGRGHLEQDPTDAQTLANVVPLEYAKTVGHKASGFFAGKRIGPANAQIRDIGPDGLGIKVDRTDGFKAGDNLIIYDVYAGDGVTIPCYLQATRNPDGSWRRASNDPAAVSK